MKNIAGFTLWMCSMALSFTVLSQPPKAEQPVHEKKTIVGDDGNIYWNKSLPVYITLSSSPDSNEGHIMKATPEEGVKPYYFDTEGINWIRTRWAVDEESGKTIYPLQEVLWPVNADGMSPVTTAEFIADGKYVVNGKTFFSGDLKVSLSAKDEVSGIENIYYSSGSEFQLYKDPISLDTEREWNLTFYAVDKVGNSESLKDGKSIAGGTGNNFSFSVDKTAPITSLETIDPKIENTLSPKSKINLTSSDEGAGVNKTYYQLDGGKETTYTGSISMYMIPEGDHMISYKSIDHVKNEEQENTYSFFLDRTAPTVDFSVSGAHFESSEGNLYVSSSSQLELTGTDNKAGVNELFMKIDGGLYSLFESPVIADQTPGRHQAFFYGTDKVENKSTVASKSYIIDTKPPVIKYAVSGPKYTRHDTLFVNKTTAFSLNPYEAGDYQSGINSTQYQYDGGSKIEYQDKFSIPGDGALNFTMHAVDNVGNGSEKSLAIFIDNEPPVLNHQFSVDKIGQKTVREKDYLIYPREVQLFLGATDKDSGTDRVYYSINDGQKTLYTKPIKGFSSNNFEVKVESIDMLGNTDTRILEFSVE